LLIILLTAVALICGGIFHMRNEYKKNKLDFYGEKEYRCAHCKAMNRVSKKGSSYICWRCFKETVIK